MPNSTNDNKNNKHVSIIRIGGAASIVALVVHMYVNLVLKQFPPESPSLEELKLYLENEAATWALVHGLRYLAIAGIALFAAGIYARLNLSKNVNTKGWTVFGLLGVTLLLANLTITNGIETFAFLDFQLLSEQKDLFFLLFYTTRVLFTAEIIAWSILIFGFSIAGKYSETLPIWIFILGIISSTAGIIAATFVVSAFTGGWAAIALDIGGLTGILWFFCVGLIMVFKGSSK